MNSPPPVRFDRLETAIASALRRAFSSLATGRARREPSRPRVPWPALNDPALFISEWK